MTKRNNGGPAFPLLVEEQGCLTAVNEGMTLRDWFAGQALNGMLAGDNTAPDTADPLKTLAAVAYAVADAMIEARK